MALVPPRGCLPGLLCADTDSGLPTVVGHGAAPLACGWPAPWATRSAFIIPDDKAYCPEEFKAPSNRLPHGQESRHCLFPRVTSPPLALPAPPSPSLPHPPPPLLPNLLAFLSLSEPIPLSLFSILFFFFSYSFLKPLRQLCRKQFETPELDAKGLPDTDVM